MRFIDEVLRRITAAPKLTRREQTWFDCIRTAHVFDITNVVPLLPTAEMFDKMDIPVRPPFPNTWTELRKNVTYQGTDSIDLQVGIIFTQASDIVENSVTAQLPGLAHLYVARMFIKPLTCTDRNSVIELNKIWMMGATMLMGLNPDGCMVLSKSFPTTERLFGLNYAAQPIKEEEEEYLMLMGWEPLMSFSLLHCRNVTTETVAPPPKLNKATVKRGHPPLVSYNLLKLIVDDTTRRRYAVDPDSDIQEAKRHSRFHLVRGHFKHLQHERFKHPGLYWWPQHWRGDPDAGTVLKDYALTTHK